MSDTPRTDAAETYHGHGRTWVPSDLARQLERELNEAKRELEVERRAQEWAVHDATSKCQ